MWYHEGNERSLSGMFNHYTVEALRMRWLKSDRWKAGIAVAGMLLFLVLMVWVPVSAAGAHERASGLARAVMGTVQATPTVDATVAALNKEKLEQEVQQLKNQNEPNLLSWLRTNAAILISTLVVVIGGLIGLFRWFGDRRSEREKRAEERFQSAVTGLADEKEGAQIGAAILLRTFLRKGYEQFYTQAFDLAVANLRFPRDSRPLQYQLWSPTQDSNTSLPVTTLRQALIVVFKESFSLARNREKRSPQSLDATGVQLDNAYLAKADLKLVWMPHASLRKVNLGGADLREADLREADLREADLSWADLSKADLSKADLSGADLWGADLREVNLSWATLCGTNFYDARLNGATLGGAKLSGIILTRADLREADFLYATLYRAEWTRGVFHHKEGVFFRKVDLDPIGANLMGTDLRRVKGLTKEQLEECKAKGAIIDDDTTISPPRSPVAPSPPSQSNDAQAPSAPPAQVNTPPPDTGGSGATSSQQGPGS